MNADDLKRRTKVFGIQTIRLIESLPHNRTSDIIGRQLLRSATSVGANYRAACRAKSRADFISKMANVEEEADESLYWLEVLEDSNIVSASSLDDLQREANELLSIVVSSIKTARKNKETG